MDEVKITTQKVPPEKNEFTTNFTTNESFSSIKIKNIPSITNF